MPLKKNGRDAQLKAYVMASLEDVFIRKTFIVHFIYSTDSQMSHPEAIFMQIIFNQGSSEDVRMPPY